MVISTMANGSKTNALDMVYTHLLVVRTIRETGLMTRRMVKVSTTGVMVRYTMAIGKRICALVKELSNILAVMCILVLGSMMR